jgi:hypothetical protein
MKAGFNAVRLLPTRLAAGIGFAANFNYPAGGLWAADGVLMIQQA